MKHPYRSFFLSFMLVMGMQAVILAEQSGQPMVVTVINGPCLPWTKPVRSVLQELKSEYSTRVSFFELDTAKRSEARKQAKRLGIERYFQDMVDSAPVVMIFTSRKTLVEELVAPKSKRSYKIAIDAVLEKSK